MVVCTAPVSYSRAQPVADQDGDIDCDRNHTSGWDHNPKRYPDRIEIRTALRRPRRIGDPDDALDAIHLRMRLKQHETDDDDQ